MSVRSCVRQLAVEGSQRLSAARTVVAEASTVSVTRSQRRATPTTMPAHERARCQRARIPLARRNRRPVACFAIYGSASRAVNKRCGPDKFTLQMLAALAKHKGHKGHREKLSLCPSCPLRRSLAERKATVVCMTPARRRRLMWVATKTLHRLPSTRPVHHRLAETLVEGLVADADGRIDRDHSQ